MVYGKNWLQLSDFHLGADPDLYMNGQHVRQRAQALLPMMQRADQILLTGDLSEDGSEASYAFLLQLLQQTAARVWALAGNHDQQDTLLQVLGPRLQQETLIQMPDWDVLLLDSSSGQLDMDELEAQAVRLRPDVALAVFLHHHPLPCGSAWMDRYLLKQPEPFLHWLDAHPQTRVVGFGHVHHALHMQRKGVDYIAAPAVAYAVQPLQDEFHATQEPPAGRWWQFLPQGQLRTALESVPQAC